PRRPLRPPTPRPLLGARHCRRAEGPRSAAIRVGCRALLDLFARSLALDSLAPSGHRDLRGPSTSGPVDGPLAPPNPAFASAAEHDIEFTVIVGVILQSIIEAESYEATTTN